MGDKSTVGRSLMVTTHRAQKVVGSSVGVERTSIKRFHPPDRNAEPRG